ncbi:MAG TPA: NUDIX hydrolase [Clostridiaceae bacterium]|jgi:ADP-ribose pyrophosphatase|nr:NUDIX hydrolase [Clostridiaceae bacterium]
MEYYEKTISAELKYKGNIIDVEKIMVELPDGKLASRDVVRNAGASVVVPVINDEIILVQQFRKPPEKIFIELPAGKLEDGEDPAVCAARELKEETGYSAKKLEKIMELYPAPAFSDEILHVYLATELIKGEASPDEGEFITAKAYKITEALSMIDKGIINDSKTVAGILYVSRFLNK